MAELKSGVTVVLGGQWGDEGKGKLVDILAQEADVVARCQVFTSEPRVLHCTEVFKLAFCAKTHPIHLIFITPNAITVNV